MTTDIEPISVFLSAFVVTALAGLAALLRSGNKLTLLGVASSILNGGLLGLGISLLWYHEYRENLYFLVGVCVLAGLGGMTMIDFLLTLFQKGGLSIKVGKGTGIHDETKP